MMTATNYLMGYYRHCVIALHTLSYFILLTPQRDWNYDYHLHFTKEEIWLVLANPGIILTQHLSDSRALNHSTNIYQRACPCYI